ncbi:hypothetical protein [Sinomicrobium oceani]|uniref:hypothetical protein n=1 Tax=Sinomicrobium oceani TaxID=1150368 RepID=UPI00227B876F|nr:hypothetical protein [Sinomicrobium oceani]
MFQTCAVLNTPRPTSSKHQRIREASGSLGAMYLVPFSLVLFSYPTGAVPI